ncbi:MAG: monovalent cation/H(+) antiporter subunit G [Burkholderiales bacterium]|nr:MAG: monovalent cation/H(+) antiporter subunit G [Burkholderiales bacterium]
MIEAASWVCLIAGGFFCLVGAIGLLRMPDFYTRMHAASVTDTLGAGLILLGLMLQAGPTLVAVKLLMVGLLLFFTAPAAAHALAKAAMTRGLVPALPESDACAKVSVSFSASGYSATVSEGATPASSETSWKP